VLSETLVVRNAANPLVTKDAIVNNPKKIPLNIPLFYSDAQELM